MERVDPGALAWSSIWWIAFDAFRNIPPDDNGYRKKSIDGFVAAINAVMPGHAIDRSDGPYLGITNCELAAVAAHEAKLRGVPIDTIKFLIAVYASV
jgi:hypothetical protein